MTAYKMRCADNFFNVREMILAPAVVLLLLSGAQTALGIDSAPADASYSDYPYMLYVLYTYESATYATYPGLMVSPKYILSSQIVSRLPIKGISIWYGDPLLATTPVLKPRKIIVGDDAVLLRVCSPPRLSARYSILESRFYDFSANIEAKRFFYADGGQLKYINTTALTYDNCDTENSDTINPNPFNSTRQACTSVDATAACDWYDPTNIENITIPFGVHSVLYIKDQVVGLFVAGICDLFSKKWTTPVFYTKILPSRSFILNSTNNEADQS